MQGTTADFDKTTHAEVAQLLGTGCAAKLLKILANTLAKLDGLPLGELADPAGLASIHRLMSESGMMGFYRLSRACQAVDLAGSRGPVPKDDLTALREAIASAVVIIATLNERRASAEQVRSTFPQSSSSA